MLLNKYHFNLLASPPRGGEKINASNIIGQNIKKARNEKGLTQEELVAKIQLKEIDLSRGALAKIEVGIRHVSLEELRVISEILEIDYKFLLTE